MQSSSSSSLGSKESVPVRVVRVFVALSSFRSSFFILLLLLLLLYSLFPLFSSVLIVFLLLLLLLLVFPRQAKNAFAQVKTMSRVALMLVLAAAAAPAGASTCPGTTVTTEAQVAAAMACGAFAGSLTIAWAGRAALNATAWQASCIEGDLTIIADTQVS